MYTRAFLVFLAVSWILANTGVVPATDELQPEFDMSAPADLLGLEAAAPPPPPPPPSYGCTQP